METTPRPLEMDDLDAARAGATGVIAKKVGMTRLFLEDGRQVPATQEWTLTYEAIQRTS